MPENWLLFTAEREGASIATSLVAVQAINTPARCINGTKNEQFNENLDEISEKIAYGRYWGALERVDCLHFEACYYQPIEWCIQHGYQRFEGGAQGEHKMARGLLPVKTFSAHWLRDERFASAVADFLAAEGQGIDQYVDELRERNPFKNV